MDLAALRGISLVVTATYVIATPIWRPQPSTAEALRLSITSAAMCSHERVFIHPEGMDTSAYTTLLPEWTTKAFAPRHFAGVRAYSRWLTTAEPYDAFRDSDFLAICQLDAVMLREIPAWVEAVDYSGAPWNPAWRLFVFRNRMRLMRVVGRQIGRRLVVGNGGLSFRRTSVFADAAPRLEAIAPAQVLEESNEDAVWSYYASRLGLRLANEDDARKDFLDLRSDDFVDYENYVGVHGLKDEFSQAQADLQTWAASSSG